MFSRTSAYFCLLSATLVAAIVYTATENSHAERYVGAALTGDCKGPCADTNVFSIIECDHVGDPANPCEDDRCTINSIRYLTCTPLQQAPEANACQWHINNNDYSRWIVVREMACSSVTPFTHTYPACAGSPYSGEHTPCVTQECFGPLYMGINRAEEFGRAVCGP